MPQKTAKKRSAKPPQEWLTFSTRRLSFDLVRTVRTASAEIWALVERDEGVAGEMVAVREEGCHPFYHVRVRLAKPTAPRTASHYVRRLLLHLGVDAAAVSL